ncbi:Multidrug resistance protein [Lithohypha guttulata]|uniref:Multidrug resistance protein n=1 Tax=Lithohypha guttulata TaxID=1690604 RepID=A0AAN7YG42_9EURO|nr:Multidrug resistance protein [Lithohypha guttulata]
MSVVGSLGLLNNYDRSAEMAGAPSPTRVRRHSFFHNEERQIPEPFPATRQRTRSTSKPIGDGGDSTAVPTPDMSRAASGERPLAEKLDDRSSSDEEGNAHVRELARQYTRQSIASQSADTDVFHAEPDSELDPNSDNFKPRKWTKAMLNMRQKSEGFVERTAGVSFKNMSAWGQASEADYQSSVGNVWLQVAGTARDLLARRKKRKIDILQGLDGLVKPGELLVVLGPPGSGCSTFLKTLTGETNGFNVGQESEINYTGISYDEMHKYFRGEAIYTAEQDIHFPAMLVGDTLYFAARARAPRNLPGNVGKKQYAEHLRDVIMATFGIRHTINTKVGNEFVRGVSGGERKRVTIAEACLSGAPLQAWDNSTRGLDSANAIEFCKTLRVECEVSNVAAMVAIYQAPQAAYEIFDKAIVLYEGRQIFFGGAQQAKRYFEKLGFDCPPRQTDADFLTSMTSPVERVVRKGYENKVPRTPDEFAAAWKGSAEYKTLIAEIDAYNKEHPVGGEDAARFKESRKGQQAKRQRLKSPFTLSYGQQIQLCLWRGLKRLQADPSLTFVQLFGNFIMALVIGSVFYNLQDVTSSFFSRGALLFFAILMSAFGSALEILTLYAQRPIIEKHERYALYHPSAEAYASMLTDLPYKIGNAITFNVALYFMTNLRREAGRFFFFLLISFMLTLTMSMMFRTIASVSRTLQQALTPAAILILAIVIYTGFAIPTPYMLGWSRWINYLDPVAYAFEALVVNEFHNRLFRCDQFAPGYGDLANNICAVQGAVAGQETVLGDDFVGISYRYYNSNKWRNFGILWVFMIGLAVIYLIAAEKVSAKKSKGEILVFRRGHIPEQLTKSTPDDAEAAGLAEKTPMDREQAQEDAANIIQRQEAIFQWRDVCYDIKIKSETRRILDHVDGWVKPGTLTALMGVSGAGKTTLLDVLATRVTMGVISGEMLVDGRPRDESFQRKTGYAQQQDLHLSTSTVREALAFSALLRQPAAIPRAEKLQYVEEVIKLLEMEQYADAVVGILGEGLNVEQRKRLTIGVELAAKPELLLFLDEPTSGLDSQTSWSILNLLEKLTKNGQAILCTIHQPSAMLFQRFDRLLFLAKGGKTVYFGDVGEGAKTLTSYFERNGAHPCEENQNPSEWMLEVIGAAPGSSTDIDWFDTWRNSPEYRKVQEELDTLKHERPGLSRVQTRSKDKASYREFAAPFWQQYICVQRRVFEQYWRTPSYIYAKWALCTLSGLFIGFSFFQAANTRQGLQNQLFGLFLLFTIFGQLVQQIMPLFVTQRALYEVRERPSKTYSWKAFMLSNIVAELPYNAIAATLLFFCWYYPIGLYNNAGDAVTERGALMWLFILAFLFFASTFAHMVIAAIDTAESGGNIANLAFSLCLIFCGVLAGPSQFPGFWIFMYRVSPFTYLVEGMLATAVKDAAATCLDIDFLRFPPPADQTCQSYLDPYIAQAGGYLQPGTEQSTTNCSFCQLSSTNTFLQSVNINPNNAWRDFGIMWAFIIFNIFAALALYWLVRMPKGKKDKEEKQTTQPTTSKSGPDADASDLEKGNSYSEGAAISQAQAGKHTIAPQPVEQEFQPIKAPTDQEKSGQEFLPTKAPVDLEKGHEDMVYPKVVV